MKAEKTEETLCFTITDNGNTKDSEWIREMNRQLEEYNVMVGEHIGIRNVNQRIKLLFGIVYGVKINQAEEGFSVSVQLPFMTEKN